METHEVVKSDIGGWIYIIGAIVFAIWSAVKKEQQKKNAGKTLLPGSEDPEQTDTPRRTVLFPELEDILVPKPQVTEIKNKQTERANSKTSSGAESGREQNLKPSAKQEETTILLEDNEPNVVHPLLTGGIDLPKAILYAEILKPKYLD
jgi:hypothetical protein